MSHHINFDDIGWEHFEDICLYLWFDEGYTNIKPMGRRQEGGRDAVFVDAETKDLTIFQFKHWTTQYKPAKLKDMIKEAAQKIAHYNAKKFILNSAHVPNASVNDWIDDLKNEMGFDIEYWDRSWIDLRLDNHRQDIRRQFFGIGLAHHTWQSLILTSKNQVFRAIAGLSEYYVSDLYVKRKAQGKIHQFIESDSIALAIVDRSGRGKTNLLCRIAQELEAQGKVAIFIRGDAAFHDDNGLERLVIAALGYETTDFQAHYSDITRLLRVQNTICYVVLDDLSKTDDLTRANRSLNNLLARFAETKCFKLLFACRDTSWTQIAYGLPRDMFFQSELSSEKHEQSELSSKKHEVKKHEVYVDDFDNEELLEALPLYRAKFAVSFSPSSIAIEQLKHPLLLRIFCESYKDQDLGSVTTIPVSETFDRYLGTKAIAIEHRSNRKYSRSVVQKLLRSVVGEMWQYGDTNMLREDQWATALPDLTLLERDEFVQLLAEEGLVRIDEEPVLYSRQLIIVFDKLHEYLLFHYLLSHLPEPIVKGNDFNNIAIPILQYLQSEADHLFGFKLLSLMGMVLTDISQRRQFLQLLLKWDFKTFCSCLANIPPTGKLNRCNYQSLESLARELRRWYKGIVTQAFSDEVISLIDPWEWTSSRDKSIGIKLFASPECKEISYGYIAQKSSRKSKGSINVKQVSGYPTWQISIGTQTERIELHDPDRGMMIPMLRKSYDDFHEFTRRTINYAFPSRFIGDSFNVPERMALYDVIQEIDHLLSNMERAFPLVPAEIIKEVEKTSFDTSISEFSDEQLEKYLGGLFVDSLSAYIGLIDKYFAKFKNVLNLAAQWPCSLLFVTNRTSVKYAFIPVKTEDEMRYSSRILNPSVDIADPKWHFMITDDEDEDAKSIEFKDYVLQELSKTRKMRTSFHPIVQVESIEQFFGKTPIKNLVYRWLMSEFHSVFEI